MHLIPAPTLPDPDDRHVLAAAIAGEAELTVTWNLRDFPVDRMQERGLEVVSPDDLVSRLIQEAPEVTRTAIEALRLSLRRPVYTGRNSPGVSSRSACFKLPICWVPDLTSCRAGCVPPDAAALPA